MTNESKDKTVLQPIRARRLSEIAVEQIKAFIEEGHLSVGDPLPSERELIQQLGVSRASVREALRLLESQRVIEVRPGKGAFVISNTASEVLPALMSWFEEHRDEILDVLEVREMLESRAAFLAAQRASAETVTQMQNVLAEMQAHIESGELLKAAEADRRFHLLLCEASGNRFLKLLADSIVVTLLGTRHSLLRMPGRAEVSLAQHQAIVDAIAAHDPERASNAISQHISGVREIILDLRTD